MKVTEEISDKEWMGLNIITPGWSPPPSGVDHVI